MFPFFVKRFYSLLYNPICGLLYGKNVANHEVNKVK